MTDDLAVVRRHPSTWARGVLGALSLYLQPPHDQVFSPENVERLGPLLRLFDVVLYGQINSIFYDNYHREFISRLDFRSNVKDTGLFVLAGLLLVTWFWFRNLKKGGLVLAREANGATLWLMFGALIYVTLLVNLVEIGENARLRYPVEPFFWLLVVMAVQQLITHGKSGGGNGSESLDSQRHH
jgi:hypothetical protein